MIISVVQTAHDFAQFFTLFLGSFGDLDRFELFLLQLFALFAQLIAFAAQLCDAQPEALRTSIAIVVVVD
jgi:hypothetical protein